MSDEFLMKGKVYGEHKHKLVFPVWAEIKYDEIRLHVRKIPGSDGGGGIDFLSYAGKPLHNLDYWADHFWDVMTQHGIDNLDVGVLVNGNFNDSYRWTRSSTGTPKEKLDKRTGKVAPALEQRMVQFYLFDLPDSTAPFLERAKQRIEVVNSMWLRGLDANFPSGQVVNSEIELDALFIQVRELGYEGLMVKTYQHTYQQGKRIDGWLKMKPESEADGKVVGLNRAISIEGVPLDRVGSIDVVVPGGTEFGSLAESYASPSGIAHELGRLMWENPEQYLGQWVEFKYMERDRRGGYRHPSFVRFREPK